MKKYMFFVFFFFLIFINSHAREIAYLAENMQFDCDKAVLDFPETMPKEKINRMKNYLYSRGIDKVYSIKDLKPEDSQCFVIVYKIYDTENDSLKRFFDLPSNIVFSKKKIVFGDIIKEKGDNLSGVFRIKGGCLFVADDIDNFCDFRYLYAQKSAYIFDNKVFKNSYVYDSSYSYLNCEIPVFMAIKDLDYYFKSLKEIHPILLNNKNVLQFIYLEEDAFADLTKNSHNGSIRIKDFMRILCETAAFFNDGHTYIATYYYKPNNNNSKGCGFPPFFLDYRSGDFYISNVLLTKLDKKFIGAKILKLNGEAPLEFFSPIFDLCSAETISYKVKYFCYEQFFLYSLSNIFKENQKLKVETSEGKFIVNCVDANTFKLINKPYEPNKKGIQTAFYQNGEIGYFFLPGFRNNYKFREKVKDFMKEVFKKKSKAIIIDIRDNPGGDSNFAEFLLSFLADKPFKMYSAIEGKNSPQLIKDYYPFIEKEFGISRTSEFSKIREYKPYNGLKPFKGKVYILINKGVFSTATDFSAVVQDYKLGKLIGYETGGLPSSFGNCVMVTLPFSGIKCAISAKKYYRAKYTPENADRGVIPDVPLNEEKLKPYKNDKDPFLSFVLDYVKGDLKK